LLTPDQLDRLAVVLVATRNPLNIGAVARAMSNFGFRRLRVVHPYDRAFREARSAVGASDLLRSAEEYSSIAEAVGDCSLVVGTTAVGSRQPELAVHPSEGGGHLIREHLSTDHAALLFGSEKRGLSNDDFSHCHWLMRIPTREGQISMNLGQAAAVCLYELIRAEVRPAAATVPHQATSAQLERMTRALLDTLQAGGYVKPGSEAATEEKTRRMIRRMQLDPEDSETWTGMFAKIVLRLRRNSPE
jgi:TrmH family RNA methyltransferase